MIISYDTFKTLFKCRITVDELTSLLTSQGIEVESVVRAPPVQHFQTAQVVRMTDTGYVVSTTSAEYEIVTSERLERDVSYVISDFFGPMALITPELMGWSSSKRALTVPGGISIATAWEWDDVLIEVSVGPNRGDCLSYLGLAREVFLGLRQPFDMQQWLSEMKQRYPVTYQEDTTTSVTIEAGIARYYALMDVSCPRFDAPFWLQRFLMKHGYQPKIPSVDVGHYWMILLGLPSHTFDAAAFGGSISIKRHDFQQPFSWQGIQNTPITLKGSLPVMVDEHGHVLCVPGAMGSADTAASASSQRLVVEAACFLPKTIRPMRSCVPVTESSLRFERGVWRFGQEHLLDLFAGMLCSFHPQARCARPVVSYQKEWEPPVLRTNLQAINKMSGVNLQHDDILPVLNLMGVTTEEQQYELAVPSWRYDLKIEQNLIAEILRVVGLDRIRSDRAQSPRALIRPQLVRPDIDPWIARGAQEVLTYSFTKASWAQVAGIDPADWYVVCNPISDDLRVMRPSILPSLCELLAYHQRHQLDLVPLVEVAPIYHKQLPHGQKKRVAVVWPQKNMPRYFGSTPQESSFYDIKGLIEGLIPQPISFTQKESASKLYHPHLQSHIIVQGQEVGIFGLLNPRVSQQFEWPAAWLIEIDASVYEQAQKTPKKYQPFSKRPFIVRDMVFTVPAECRASQLVERVESYDWPLCQQVRIFDFYQNAENQRSVGLEIRFQAPDRSLTDEELQPMLSHMLSDFEAAFGAKLKNVSND